MWLFLIHFWASASRSVTSSLFVFVSLNPKKLNCLLVIRFFFLNIVLTICCSSAVLLLLIGEYWWREMTPVLGSHILSERPWCELFQKVRHCPFKKFKCVKPTSEMYLYKNIADNHSIAHSLLWFICNILILWGNLFYCVNIIIIKNVNIPFWQMSRSTFI